MYKNQIEKIKEVINYKTGIILSSVRFEPKKEFFYISGLIQFIDNITILREIVEEEKRKFEGGGLEKENLYKDYLDVCRLIKEPTYNNFPYAHYAVIDLKRKLVDILNTKEFNLDKAVNPIFNYGTKLLHIQNEEPINISKGAKPNNQSILLEYLFEQMLGVEISYKEILDNAFETDSVDCAVACRDINNKINKQTSSRIDDFLIFKTTKNGHVKINSKYLSTN